ncbi:MAG: hypothetical protein ACJAUD_002870 [Crocinitomicaceae bacterium]|jgi:hypothetical protein
MKSITLVIALTTAVFAFSQNRNYIVNINYSGSMYEDVRATYNAFSFSPGVEYKNGFSFNLGIGYFKTKSESFGTNNYRKMTGIQSSITASKRILQNETVLSPLASVTIGSTLFNYDHGCFSNMGEIECDKSLLSEDPGVDKFRFFAKVKFMFDFQFSNFSLRFGPTYTFQEGRMANNPKERSNSQILDGYGLEGAIIFSLKRQK